ncbi:transcriptional regulator [Alishewanella tabrizica]|uniref:Transcriptional regulator n=2 Tax=Alishewanella tabrizica TaxID=671278 RepID=A0ABQ2WL45_9ALTE|nr:transcriptional regulator [Alishewanella tabrizica]
MVGSTHMKTLKPGEIAEYCDVHHRTVSRWIANGQLKGHKLPGRGNYRVQLDDFLAFLQKQKMPLPTELMGAVQPSTPKVMIIDDEPAFRAAIKRALYGLEYDITLANDGFQAGVKLMQLQPDLITLDLDMPGLNGFEVLTFIRQTPELAGLKVLVISGLSEDDLVKAKTLGADAVLPKPFENTALSALVTKMLAT